ncbi:MAG: patatin-like phospholipase family protein [Candidatus Eisenbacteria bacterium]
MVDSGSNPLGTNGGGERPVAPARCRVGLALSGGAARSMAHIGVLKAFDEGGVPIDALAGTSGGAIIGVLYASGVPVPRMEEIAQSLRRRDLGTISLSRMGLISIRPFQAVLEAVTGPLRLETLRIPMAIVATNLVRRERRVFRTGDAIRAALASASMPHVYRPMEIDGELYTDGGVVEYLPATALEAYRPLVRVGVHLLPEDRYRSRPRHLGQVMATIVNIVARANSAQVSPALDVTIRPAVAPFAPFDLTNAGGLVEAGYHAGRREVPRILSLLEERERWMGELGPEPEGSASRDSR